MADNDFFRMGLVLMKVGDLVRNIYTGEIGLVTRVDSEDLYVDVDWKHLVPEEHLVVINESR